MNSVRSIKLSLKYHRFTLSGFKVIEIGTFKFAKKTQFKKLLRICFKLIIFAAVSKGIYLFHTKKRGYLTKGFS